MKKTFVIISVAFFAISCNDDVAPVKETNDALVTRFSENGLTRLELFYDDEKRLYRLNSLYLGNLITYTLYEYNEYGLKELRRYDGKDHSLDYRSVFTLDNFGRVVKSENYNLPDLFNETSSVDDFEYNSSNQLIVEQLRFSPTVVQSRYENTYNGDGQFIKQLRIIHPNQEEEYRALYEVTPGPQLIPLSWQDHLFILGLTGRADEIRRMFISNSSVKVWTSNGVLSDEINVEMSGHVYDEDGNTTGLVMTRKDLLDPQASEIVTTVNYDYRK